MRIAILGCGAMGTVMGAYFAQNGLDVYFIDNYQAHVDALNKNGAKIIGCSDITVPVKAITTEQMSGKYDLVFLFTKQLANSELLPTLLDFLQEDSVVCTLQNGVPEPFVAECVGKSRTIGGTVLWGATFILPGVSELTQDISKSDHLFEIGEMDGQITHRIEAVAGVLRHMGPVKITETLMASRWGKLVNNACMSGMSAVCGATFGTIRDNPKARACLSYLGREVRECCEAEGYMLPMLLSNCSPERLAFKTEKEFKECQELFVKMYQGFDTAKASMLQDLEKGKLTEVTMINGYVTKIGDIHGIETPFNDKVVEIIKKIECGELTYSLSNLDLFSNELFEYPIF